MKGPPIEAIVFGCMDYRFQGTLHQVVSQRGCRFGNYDCVCVKGGAENEEQVLEHLRVAIKLHQPRRVILTAHEDCGAGAQKECLERTKQLIQNEFETIQVETCWLTLAEMKETDTFSQQKSTNDGGLGVSLFLFFLEEKKNVFSTISIVVALSALYLFKKESK